MRLVLYTGKGGVGKTTVAAATGVCAAERGRRTLVASADAAHSLGDVLEQRLSPLPTRVAEGRDGGHLDAVEIDARVEMTQHWGRIRDFLVSVLVHQGVEGVVADELALLPGAEELATLLAVEDVAEAGDYDFVVVDCAPTDAALRVLTLPDIADRTLRMLLPLARAISAVAAPVARRLTSFPLPDSAVFGEVDELLQTRITALQKRVTGPQTSARLVVTPERMVIDEARRAHTELSLFEVPCDAVVMNRLLPEAATREPHFRAWGRLQQERRNEVAELFAPMPVLESPLQEDEATGLHRLADVGRALFAHTDPDAVLSASPRVRFARDDEGWVAHIPLPGADPARLEVAVVDGDLSIATGLRRRSLALPRRIATLPVASARLDGPSLVVRFAADAEVA